MSSQTPFTILSPLLLVAYSTVVLHVCLGAHLPLSDTSECSSDLRFDIMSNTQLEGEFKASEGTIIFHAIINDNDFTIQSETKYSHHDNTMIDTTLSFPNVNDQKIPGMQHIVVEAAQDLVDSSSCNIPSKLSTSYQALSDALFHCTDSMGYTQLRYGLMYHVSVVGTAQRLCDKVDGSPVCTVSPSYEYEGEMFMCMEDMQDTVSQVKEMAAMMMDGRKTSVHPTDASYGSQEAAMMMDRRNFADPTDIPYGSQEAAIMDGRKTSVHPTDSYESQELAAMMMDRRTFLDPTGIPYGSQQYRYKRDSDCELAGSDPGCCGNYPGCCVYSHPICYWHDEVCECCHSWWCGWQCQKAPTCD